MIFFVTICQWKMFLSDLIESVLMTCFSGSAVRVDTKRSWAREEFCHTHSTGFFMKVFCVYSSRYKLRDLV